MTIVARSAIAPRRRRRSAVVCAALLAVVGVVLATSLLSAHPSPAVPRHRTAVPTQDGAVRKAVEALYALSVPAILDRRRFEVAVTRLAAPGFERKIIDAFGATGARAGRGVPARPAGAASGAARLSRRALHDTVGVGRDLERRSRRESRLQLGRAVAHCRDRSRVDASRLEGERRLGERRARSHHAARRARHRGLELPEPDPCAVATLLLAMVFVVLGAPATAVADASPHHRASIVGPRAARHRPEQPRRLACAAPLLVCPGGPIGGAVDPRRRGRHQGRSRRCVQRGDGGRRELGGGRRRVAGNRGRQADRALDPPRARQQVVRAAVRGHGPARGRARRGLPPARRRSGDRRPGSASAPARHVHRASVGAAVDVRGGHARRDRTRAHRLDDRVGAQRHRH